MENQVQGHTTFLKSGFASFFRFPLQFFRRLLTSFASALVSCNLAFILATTFVVELLVIRRALE